MSAAIVSKVPTTGRVLRRPQHTFQLRHKPFVIQPFLIAPVLPGETMTNLLLQSRAVTDPLNNALTGWWLEYYIFYIKHRDLDDRDEFVKMVLQPGYDLSALHSGADPDTYHSGSGLDWSRACLRRVVDEYFRDEGEVYSDHTINGNPISKVQQRNWMDSLMLATVAEAGEGTIGPATTDTASEIDAMMLQWEHLRAMNMTTMSYEQFLETYGVHTSAAEHNRPELIRYLREWQYPSNTVDPTDGSVASAVSWAVAERADKDRFFKEPGFIFGVTVARPKVYFANQDGAAVNMMDSALNWLPAIMMDEPATSLIELPAGSIPVSAGTAEMWADVRDLFLYGDQFVNYALTDADSHLLALPVLDGTRTWYASTTDIDEMFVGATPASLVTQDGIVSISVKGTQVDQTPTMSGVR